MATIVVPVQAGYALALAVLSERLEDSVVARLTLFDDARLLALLALAPLLGLVVARSRSVLDVLKGG